MGAAACKCDEREGRGEGEGGKSDRIEIGKHPYAQPKLPDGLKRVNFHNRKAFVPTHISNQSYQTGTHNSEAEHTDMKHSSPIKVKNPNILEETSPRERLNAMIREMQVRMEFQQSRSIDGDNSSTRQNDDSLEVNSFRPVDEFLYPKVVTQDAYAYDNARTDVVT
mmetsp:Transcript_1270/g.2754  ORF Transcript_1270/g.2754 Transcript_1270/m.2754 type:complete len:166 (-) Transcript_1270:162-659(-)